MSEYARDRERAKARDGRDEWIERRAMKLIQDGRDWWNALMVATSEYDARSGAGRTGGGASRQSPGKRSRTASMPARIAPTTPETRRARARRTDGVIQARSAGDMLLDPSDDERERVRRAAAHAMSGTTSPLPFLDEIQRLFGHHDVSAIEAHLDERASEGAAAMSADAFASGMRVVFGDTPDLFTAAHEAAHVVQQRAAVDVPDGIGREGDRYERHADEVASRVVRGESAEDLLDGFVGGPASQGSPQRSTVAAPAVQMRRIPINVAQLLTAIGGIGNSTNFGAHAAGVERLIERALAELTPTQRALVMTNRRAPGSLTQAQFDALPRRERLIRTAYAIMALFPPLIHGAPALIDVGPTTPLERANLNTLVAHTNVLFIAIASGSQDASIGQVFGAANVATAKAKYANAQTWMNTLYARGKIVTDRSGYNDEAGLGGLTGFQDQISLEPDAMDHPSAHYAVVTLLHEAMHAGNNDVDDNGYLGGPQFDTRSEADKLNNAAHYEVVAWRIREPANPYAYPVVPATVPPTFRTFVPAGATVGGVTAALPTISQRALREASETLRAAWGLALNLHTVYVKAHLHPSEWSVPQSDFGGMRFDNSVPFWSKVSKLTIHQKSVIDPSSPDPARHPVSQIDVALSEGLIRRLSAAIDVLNPVETDADVRAFEAAHATPAQIAAAFPGGVHADVDRERDFILRLVLNQPSVHPITGSVPRDLRVVKKLGDPVFDLWTMILAPRSPGSFAD